jgi:hypothetical protein
MNILSSIVISTLLLLSQVMQQPVVNTQPASSGCAATAGWAMTEGTGGTFHDSIGTNNATQAGGGVTWTANAIKSGVSSPVWNTSTLATAASDALTNFDGTKPFSLSVWTVTNGFPSVLFGDANTSSNFQGWSLELQPGTGTLTLFINNLYPTNSITVTSTSNFATNTLTYIVATYDGSQKAAGVKMYLNGVQNAIGTVFEDNLTGSAASGLPVTFNSRSNGTTVGSGAKGFWEIYPCVLSQAQITANTAAGPGIY